MKIHIGRDVQTTRTGDIFHITGFLSGYKFLPLESRKCNSFFEMTDKDNSWHNFLAFDTQNFAKTYTAPHKKPVIQYLLQAWLASFWQKWSMQLILKQTSNIHVSPKLGQVFGNRTDWRHSQKNAY